MTFNFRPSCSDLAQIEGIVLTFNPSLTENLYKPRRNAPQCKKEKGIARSNSSGEAGLSVCRTLFLDHNRAGLSRVAKGQNVGLWRAKPIHFISLDSPRKAPLRVGAHPQRRVTTQSDHRDRHTHSGSTCKVDTRLKIRPIRHRATSTR